MTYLIDAWLDRPHPYLRILHRETGEVCAVLEEEALNAQRQGLLWVWERERLPISLSFAYMQRREQEPAIQALLKGLHQIEQIRRL